MSHRTAMRWMTAVALAGALVGGCASIAPVPPQPTALPNGVTPQQMVASIRAAATASGGAELDVQPLRDPQVEDLRQDAEALHARGLHDDAAALLQQALEVNPDDPAVMQEAAEAAVLLWRFDQAEQLARRAHGLGSGVGPLCRRHWATVEQVAEARLALASVPPQSGSRAEAAAQAEAAARAAQQARLDAAAARQAIDACTIAAPKRF